MTSSNEIFFAKTNGACYWIVTRPFIQIFKKCNDPKNPLREERERKKKKKNNKHQTINKQTTDWRVLKGTEEIWTYVASQVGQTDTFH